MSRSKQWDLAHGLSHLRSSLHRQPDPDGMVADPGGRGWIMRLKRLPSSWTELTLGFLVQISSEMVAGCLCWVHGQWPECFG
jgi:hypothetical protein